jgi:dTDP-4-dehydrorhamnose 3,5-epimerase-like enzyme
MVARSPAGTGGRLLRLLKVDDCKLVELPVVHDPQGNLTFIEEERHAPFRIARVYHLYDVPGGAKRGGHAHRSCKEMLVAMSGSFEVVLNDGLEQKSVRLNRSYIGLYLPPMIWRELVDFSSGSVCMVLASAYYEEADYIRDQKEFREIATTVGD